MLDSFNKEIDVFVRLYPEIMVDDRGIHRKSMGEELYFKDKKFIIENIGPVYTFHRGIIKAFIKELSPRNYTVKIRNNYILYSAAGNELKIFKHRVFLNGKPVATLEEIKNNIVVKRQITTPQPDLVISESIIESDQDKLSVYPKDNYDTFPKSYSFKKKDIKDGYYSIITPDGEKKIPVIPALLQLYRMYEVDYYMKSIADRETAWNAPQIIPTQTVVTSYGIFYYARPDYWKVLRGSKYYERRGDHWKMNDSKEDTPYGRGKKWVTSDGVFYVYPEFKTGQNALLARDLGNTMRIYGIVTPEGMFVVDVPKERLEKPEPISVFEKNVKLVGTFFVFPVRVPFKKSFVNLFGYKKHFQVIIDGVQANATVISNFGYTTGAGVLKKFGFKEKDFDIILHYGLHY